MKSVDVIMVPAKTAASAKGDGTAIDVSGANERVFLVVLEISKIIEQEALELSVFGSADAITWSAKPIVTFPQRFYCEQTPLLMDLTAHADVKFVRAHWDVARWGRGTETPMFEFGVTMSEVPAEILNEVRTKAIA